MSTTSTTTTEISGARGVRPTQPAPDLAVPLLRRRELPPQRSAAEAIHDGRVLPGAALPGLPRPAG